MNKHTTNYYNTFIEVAEDTKVSTAKIPSTKKHKKTVAAITYDLIAHHPYRYTSDDVLFHVYVERNDLPKTEYTAEREIFFSKGRACLRASPLTKTHGFGIHANEEGKIALYRMETEEYRNFLADNSIKKVKAMRSSRV